MANPFDQFDKTSAPAASGNPFDQFDTGPVTGPNAIPLPPGARQSMAAEAAARPQPKEASFLDKLRGAGEAALAVGTGMTSGAAGYIGGALGGIAGSIANGDFGTEKGLRGAKEAAEASAARYTYAPATEKGKEYAQNVADTVDSSGVAGLPIGPELNAVGALARPAAAQVRSAVATDAFAARQLANKVAAAKILPTIDPERAAILQKAIDAGFSVSPDMLGDNKFVKILTDTLRKVPLSGSTTEANQIAFNRALIKAVGGDAMQKKLNAETFSQAMKKSGAAIGDVSARTDVPLDADFSSALTANIENAEKFQTSDVGRIVKNYVDDIAAKAEANGGVVDGQAFRRLNSQIGRKIRGTTDGDLKMALEDLQTDMLTALEKNVTDPADLSILQDAKRKYAIGKTLEPLVAKSLEGDISPSALMARVNGNAAGKTAMAMNRSGELGDLARIGQLLKEPPSSLTAERQAVYNNVGLGAAGVGASVLNPGVAAGVAGTWTAANLYNRLSPILARRIVRNSIGEQVAPVRFGSEPLALAEESAFTPRPATPAIEQPYAGSLSLADAGDNTATLPRGAPAIIKQGDQLNAPVAPWNPSADLGNGIDFPLRQEVLQQPEIASAINDFRAEAQRLGTIAQNAISPAVRSKAVRDLAQIQAEFGVGMERLGISDPAGAHGLNRPLYQAGSGTSLPISKTMDRVARQRALQGIGNAKTIDEAISAASGQ